jgi:hypothetical protein
MITVDPALKKQFIEVFLMTPHSTVIDAMRQANFTEEDIANHKMRRYLQRALPGGSIKGMKAKIMELNPPSPDRPTVSPPEEVIIDAETVLSSLSPGTARKKEKRKICNNNYYEEKKEKKVRTIIVTRRRHVDYNNNNNNNDDGDDDDGGGGSHGTLGCLYQRESTYASSKEDGKVSACQAGCRQNS